MNGTAWIAQQLIRVSTTADRPPPVARRQSDWINEGTTCWILLAILYAHPDRLWTTGQLHRAALGMRGWRGASAKVVSWSLVLLQRRGLVETFQDTRNPRYLRYRIHRYDTRPSTPA